MGNNKDQLDAEISAGRFSAWLRQMVQSLKGAGFASVPCGTCNACCNSSLFIYIRPGDEAAIKSIPKEYLFPVPGLQDGHRLLGYDSSGRCLMYKDGQCSIYEQRPQTCRQYDCRVLAATGFQLTEKKTQGIATRAGSWQFDFENAQDRREYTAVRAAADFIRQHAGKFPDGIVPASVTQQAIFAVCVHEYFLTDTSCKDMQTKIMDIVSLYRQWC